MMNQKSKFKLIGSTLLFLCLIVTIWFALQWYRSSIEIVFYESTSSNLLSDEDAKSLVQIHQECFESVRRDKLSKYLKFKSPPSSPLEETIIKKRVESLISDGRVKSKDIFKEMQNLYITKYHGEIVGMFNCFDDDNFTNSGVMIYNVCLSKELRGRGIGKKMMQHAIAHCLKPNKVLALTVYKDHTQTIKLYESLGFAITDPIKIQEDSFDFFDKYFMLYVNSLKN